MRTDEIAKQVRPRQEAACVSITILAAGTRAAKKGLARHICPEVSVYIGEDAHNILKAVSAYIPDGHAFTNPRSIKNSEQLEIGPFRITPFLVDHSAFDAYSLLIKADGNGSFIQATFAPMDARTGYLNRWSIAR